MYSNQGLSNAGQPEAHGSKLNDRPGSVSVPREIKEGALVDSSHNEVGRIG